MSTTGIVQSQSDPNMWVDSDGNTYLKQTQQNEASTSKSNTPTQKSLTSWKVVESKRKRSPTEQKNVTQKQAKLNDYWLGTPKAATTYTSNSFEKLTESDAEFEPEIVIKEPKPPPIFIDGVNNLGPLHILLKEKAKNGYEIKVINNECVKVQTIQSTDYTDLCKELEVRKTQFHTYKMKKDRNFRVVLKNLHHSTDVNDLRAALQEKGHTALIIHNMKQRGSGNPTSLFFVELKPNENNKDVYEIDLILNHRVKFEPPHKKREIPQCAKCQRYGHTKGFCNRDPRCVKCAGSHTTVECHKKERSDNVKCVLCDGNHPANYKGCTVYKQLQDKKFPALRKKQFVQPKSSEDNTFNFQKVQPGISYAQMAREQSQQIQLENLSQHQPNSLKQSNDMLELKSMMKGLMEQMGTMLNLLTTLVSKLA